MPHSKDHAIAAACWIATHPRAMALFETMALRRVSVKQRFGLKALVEAVRWNHAIDNVEGEDWKLNNNYTSHIARWLIEHHPEIAGYIELRHLHTQAA